MISEWAEIQRRRDEIVIKLSDPALERSKRLILQKELSRISSILEQHAVISTLEEQIDDIKKQAETNTDKEMFPLFQEECSELEKKIAIAHGTLNEIMYPPAKHDDRSVFLEIRAGTGGQEAALFAADLSKMYTNYALKRGWKVDVDSMSTTDLGGFKEVVLHIKGASVFGHLKHESGVHRVQRVPVTETSGRIHTSTATVAVLPEAKEVDVKINHADLRIDVYRSGGSGGQHVNTTDSAVRITHIPTGVVVTCQDERSQHKNKAKAMKHLESRILLAQLEKQKAERGKMRKEQIGGGERAEKVRTYNFPQNRVSDHQVDLTLKKLDRVIEGDLDEIIDALQEKERKDRYKQSFLETIRSY